MLPELTPAHIALLKNAGGTEPVTRLLRHTQNFRLNRAVVISQYSDILLYHAAFPASAAVHQMAVAGLQRVTGTLKTLAEKNNTKTITSLSGTGLPYTSVCCAFSSSLTRWLLNRFEQQVFFHSSGADPETVKNILQAWLPGIEFEKSAYDEQGLLFRLKKITGLHQPTACLQWLLGMLEESALSFPVKEELYRQLDVFTEWQLTGNEINRVLLRIPVTGIYASAKKPARYSSAGIVNQKTTPPVKLNLVQQQQIIDAMRASLAFYCRETDPFTYAIPEELYLFQPEKGLQVAIAGMKKERRLTLETYYGYMLFSNGVPIAYGGGWLWGNQCKIGINIFPPFRKGGSGWLFCQVMRAYRQLFGAKHFVVKPYQFGKNNSDGLKSGAFWFYYKLGFRPVNNALKNIAAREWAQIKKNRQYRTPVPVLKQFTACNLSWCSEPGVAEQPLPEQVSAAISVMINKKYSGNRQIAVNICTEKLFRVLPQLVAYRGGWHGAVLESWALLSGCCHHLEQFTAVQKRVFAKLALLKLTGSEQEYVHRLSSFNKFWQLLPGYIIEYE